MRPLLDLRFFADLPKFLWFDNGDGSSGGDGTGGDSGTSAAAASSAAADAAAAGFGGQGGTTGAPAGTSSTGTGSFGGTADSAGPAASATGTSVGVNAAGGGAAPGGAAPGGAGGTAGSSSGGTGGPGAATGAGGGATGGPGAATGGGGGTASGGSGISASVRSALQSLLGGNPADALRGAVRNAQVDFGVPGVPSLGVPEGVGGQGAAPVGQVTVSPLGEPGPNLATLAQQLFGGQAAQAARGGIGSDTTSPATNTTRSSGSSTATSANTGPTSGGNAPGVGGAAVGGGLGGPADFGPARGSMGDVSTAAVGPNAALGGGPGNASETATGTPANAAPTATTVAAPSPAAVTSGLGSSAPAAAANAASPSSPTSPNAPNAPAPVDMGGLLNLVLSLVMGGNPGPQLTQLAQAAARPQLAPNTQAGA